MMMSARLKSIRTLRAKGPVLATMMGTLLLVGCSSKGEIVVEDGVGITAIRSVCPAVGIPDHTGNITLFSNPASQTEDSLDIVADMTDVRTKCDKSGNSFDETKARRIKAGDLVHSDVSFVVEARRSNTHGTRDVALPWFIAVLRGGSSVVSKRIGMVNLHFADGQALASANGNGVSMIDLADATLDPKIRDQIIKKRKAGQADAAVDPLADPKIKEAISRATFEVLVGFQLNDQQLAYNATR